MYYDGIYSFFLDQFDDLTTEQKNNQASYDLGLYHAKNGFEENLTHCVGPDSEGNYKLGYKRGKSEMEGNFEATHY
jgi:hypothetical protein